MPLLEGVGDASEEKLNCTDPTKKGGGGIWTGGQHLKETLMKKYSNYLSNLRKELQKNRKKGNLPKGARALLMDWWTKHYQWPYPTVSSLSTTRTVPLPKMGLFFIIGG